MRLIILFACVILWVNSYSQRIEISPRDIVSGLERSLPYAREKFHLKNDSLIYVNDTFPYVRLDGKVLLSPVKKDDCPWTIIKEGIMEDSLRYYGDFNYEATLMMNHQLSRTNWLLADYNCLLDISNQIGQFTNEIKSSKSQIIEQPVDGVLAILIIIIICLFTAADYSMRFLKK